MRRYRAMVLLVVLGAAVLGGVAAMREQAVFRAEAALTVPHPVSSGTETSDQYLASQVVLLRSRQVAVRAARIADRTLGSATLRPEDFKGQGASLDIVAPDVAQPGTYGANVVTIDFRGTSAEVARVGANAVLRAFDAVRSRAIRAEGRATVAGVEQAMGDARTRAQLSDLVDQRTKALVDAKMDLAQHPTVAWAPEPVTPVNGNVKRSAALGLLVGMVVATGLAYARAVRHRTFDDAHQPAQVYDAPLLGVLPASPDVAVAPATASDRPPPPLVHARPASRDAESFRFAARSLRGITPARGRRSSLAFVSCRNEPARSGAVADLALAVAEDGTRVLAVDVDSSVAGLTTRLLDVPEGEPLPTVGLVQALNGDLAMTDCVARSPLQEQVAVLPPGRSTAGGAPRSVAGPALRQVLGKGKAGYDVVLVDAPGLLEEAVGTDVVSACDMVVVVIGPRDRVDDHLEVVRRLGLVDAKVAGYLFRPAERFPELSWARALWRRVVVRPGAAPEWLRRPLSVALGTRR